MSDNISRVDFPSDAAHYLRDEASNQGIDIGSSHAHMLVAAHLGYSNRVALMAKDSSLDPTSQWLHQEQPNVANVRAAIERMDGRADLLPHVPFIVDAIRHGLAPECVETGIRSANNIPVGDVRRGDDTEWVHPSSLDHPATEYGRCVLCRDEFVFRLADLDKHGLCEEHAGEFDESDEERQGWQDLYENLTKDGD